MTRVYTTVEQIDFTVKELPSMPLPEKVLMIDPAWFDVTYVINPHMAGKEGTVDRQKAVKEWKALRDGFLKLNLNVIVLDGQPGLPDMVFAANQSLPYCGNEGNRKVVMSIMHAPQREGEVPYVEKWFRQNGYEISHLDKHTAGTFEGSGDGIWHFGKQLLWGGFGWRSSINAFHSISQILNVPVIPLELCDERFYHLDTCFCPLDEKSVLIYPDAFTTEGLALIHHMFDRIIETDSHEATHLLATNAACPDGRHVLIQKGCNRVIGKLREHGFVPLEYSTDEFLKSGGSVYCMKLFLW